MNIVRLVLVSVLILSFVYGCGEEEQSPLEIVSKTSRIPVIDNEEVIEIEGMVLIPAGEFRMGDHHGDGESDEIPVHIVYLDDFHIDKYEVTNAQFKEFIEVNPAWSKDQVIRRYGHEYYLRNWDGNNHPEGKGEHPVAEVSWYSAAAYAQWVGKRLPTEAQWEKAARGGLVGEKYVWGDSDLPPEGAGNFPDETAKKEHSSWSIFVGYDDGYAETAPVGSFAPNGYDLYDMEGNVDEWCADLYGSGYYSVSPKSNPTGPGVPLIFENNDFISADADAGRVIRGGSWSGFSSWSTDFLRVASRDKNGAVDLSRGTGFRCVAQD